MKTEEIITELKRWIHGNKVVDKMFKQILKNDAEQKQLIENLKAQLKESEAKQEAA